MSAIVSAIVFNALIIVALIPLALRGVRYTPASAHDLLRRNLLLYGLGGLVLPFAGQADRPADLGGARPRLSHAPCGGSPVKTPYRHVRTLSGNGTSACRAGAARLPRTS
ncbi:hypothetical protein EASAB2608_00190 [Streptomyces sp. EAS-AB2608]|nr:hypothetical protein EASAB2608_00190 [Streptomyces sp. EAS-AB2608]